jgi:hypothetical protein
MPREQQRRCEQPCFARRLATCLVAVRAGVRLRAEWTPPGCGIPRKITGILAPEDQASFDVVIFVPTKPSVLDDLEN